MRQSKRNKHEVLGNIGHKIVQGLMIGMVMGLVVVGGVGLWGYTHRLWKGEGRFTVITLGNVGMVSSFDAATGLGRRVVIPGETELVGVGGRGYWRVKVLKEVENKGKELNWAADTVADNLGITYVGEWDTLTWWDKLEWWWRGRSISWKDVELSEDRGLVEVTGGDGEKRVRLDADWDTMSQNWFVDTQLQKEGLSVQIVNTVGVAGLGSHAARLIERTGIRTGLISDGGPKIDRCQLEVDRNNANLRSVTTIQYIFGCDVITQEGTGRELKLVLGQQYAKWWLGI